MIVLVINAGSSSLKYQLFDMETEAVLAKGNCEKIGMDEGIFTHKTSHGYETLTHPRMETHVEALFLVMERLLDQEHGVIKSIQEISAVGHRVVMGGPNYLESVAVDEAVLREIEDMSPLAPLHNPAELATIRACQKILGIKPCSALCLTRRSTRRCLRNRTCTQSHMNTTKNTASVGTDSMEPLIAM